MNELQEVKDTSKQREYEYTLIEPIEQASHTGEDKAPISKLILSSPTRAVMKDIFKIKSAFTVGTLKSQELTHFLKQKKSQEEKAEEFQEVKKQIKESGICMIKASADTFGNILQLSGDCDVIDCFIRIFKSPGMCKLEGGANIPPQMIDALSVDDIEAMSNEYIAFFMSRSNGIA